MDLNEFRKLFESALNLALKNAEERLQRQIPSEVKVLLHGAGYMGTILEPLEAATALYISEDRFFRIIDVAVVKVNKTTTTVFVRASSHTPSTFEKTWNDPAGCGPFKQLVAEHISIDE